MTTLALIGVGKWGKNYLTTAEKLDNVQIKYISARNLESLKKFSDQYQKVTSVTELLGFSDLDGVIIATPPASHFELVKEAIVKGVNVLVEKPLTLDLKQAEELVSLSKTSRSKVMVGHIFLFNPAYTAAKNLLHEIGPLKEIIFEGLGTSTRDDYSVIWDWGPHPISICLDLLGQSPDSYEVVVIEKSVGGLVSDAEIHLGFRSGIQARIKINCQPSPKVRNLQLIGENGVIVLDDTNQNNQKIALTLTNKDVTYPKYDSISPLEVEMNAFAEIVNKDKSVESDLEFGVNVVRILSEIESKTR